MAEDPADLVADWRFDTIDEYLDVDAGVPVTQGEALSILNAEDRAIALTAAEMRVESLVSVLDDRALAMVGVNAVDRLYLGGTRLSLWSPDISAYVHATWGVIFATLGRRGYRMHYVAEHLYPERIGRPLELFPDIFAAAGFAYVCPHVFANHLPEALEAEVDPEGLAPFLHEGRRLALETAVEHTEAGRHLAYIEIAPEEGAVSAVLDLVGSAPGTIGVHRQGDPSDGSPQVTLSKKGPSA